ESSSARLHLDPGGHGAGGIARVHCQLTDLQTMALLPVTQPGHQFVEPGFGKPQPCALAFGLHAFQSLMQSGTAGRHLHQGQYRAAAGSRWLIALLRAAALDLTGDLLHPGQIRGQGTDIGANLGTLPGQWLPDRQVKDHQQQHHATYGKNDTFTRCQSRPLGILDGYVCMRSRAFTPSPSESAPCRDSRNPSLEDNSLRSISNSAKYGRRSYSSIP